MNISSNFGIFAADLGIFAVDGILAGEMTSFHLFFTLNRGMLIWCTWQRYVISPEDPRREFSWRGSWFPRERQAILVSLLIDQYIPKNSVNSEDNEGVIVILQDEKSEEQNFTI